MARGSELTDQVWRRLTPLLPPKGQRGGQWRDHRQVISGILWKLRTGAGWRDIPARYGPWKTAYDRFVRWRQDGTWDRLLTQVQGAAQAAGQLDWTVCVASTIVRAHQHGAGARRQPSHADVKRGVSIWPTRRWGGAEVG